MLATLLLGLAQLAFAGWSSPEDAAGLHLRVIEASSAGAPPSARAAQHTASAMEDYNAGQFIVVPADETVRQPRNDTRAAQEPFRFALFTDTHLWLPSMARTAFIRRAANAPVRDGLLVSDSERVLAELFAQLRAFRDAGGAFGIHAGDVACGGNSFRAPAREFEASLRAYRARLRAALGAWPVFHVPGTPVDELPPGCFPHAANLTPRRTSRAGNHDLYPTAPPPKDGSPPKPLVPRSELLAPWHSILYNASSPPPSLASRLFAAFAGRPPTVSVPPVNYRAINAGGTRILLLDSQDGVEQDTDGHGHVGRAQLAWIQRQLDDSAAAGQQVAPPPPQQPHTASAPRIDQQPTAASYQSHHRVIR